MDKKNQLLACLASLMMLAIPTVSAAGVETEADASGLLVNYDGPIDTAGTDTESGSSTGLWHWRFSITLPVAVVDDPEGNTGDPMEFTVQEVAAALMDGSSTAPCDGGLSQVDRSALAKFLVQGQYELVSWQDTECQGVPAIHLEYDILSSQVESSSAGRTYTVNQADVGTWEYFNDCTDRSYKKGPFNTAHKRTFTATGVLGTQVTQATINANGFELEGDGECNDDWHFETPIRSKATGKIFLAAPICGDMTVVYNKVEVGGSFFIFNFEAEAGLGQEVEFEGSFKLPVAGCTPLTDDFYSLRGFGNFLGA